MLEGLLQGEHRQRRVGEGSELAELREYQPGDEVRRIEWNVTARTGTPHVRVHQGERDVAVWLLVDRSPSMDFGTTLRSKRDLAVQASLALAHVALRRGDHVGAMVYPGGPTTSARPANRRPPTAMPGDHAVVPFFPGLATRHSSLASSLVMPPGAKRRQLLHLSQCLAAEQPPGPMSWSVFLERAAQSIRRRSLVFVISDFLAEDAWEWSLQLLARRHEVNAFWLVDPREQALPDVGVIECLDPETGERCWVDTGDRQVRARYAQAAELRMARVAGAMTHLGIDLLPISTEQDLLPALLRFASMKRTRRGDSSASCAPGAGSAADTPHPVSAPNSPLATSPLSTPSLAPSPRRRVAASPPPAVGGRQSAIR
jgi:uncharacterized protein (DUF58 family)